MFPRIEVAGYVTRWLFQGSWDLGEWLARCPWHTEGGLAYVQVASPEDAPLLMEAIEQAVYGYDRLASKVRVRTISVQGEDRSAVAALCEALEVSTAHEKRTQRAMLSEVLRVQPFVCLVDLSSYGSFIEARVPRLHELEALRDELLKLPEPATLTLVLLLRAAGARAVFECARGFPIGSPIACEDPMEAWRCYVHVRLAWECAGEPSRTMRWGVAVSERVAPEHDDALECALNDLALESWRALPETVRTTFRHWVEASREAPVAPWITQGLLWRPRPDGTLWPVPWVARALLCEGVTHGRRWLRNALVCAPLTDAILGACLELEGTLRGSARPVGEPGSSTLEVWKRFCDGTSRNGRSFLPDGCPAAPGDAWDLAPFGELLVANAWPRALQSTLHDLRELRNDLAHGHYVSWRNILALRAVRQSLRGSHVWKACM